MKGTVRKREKSENEIYIEKKVLWGVLCLALVYVVHSMIYNFKRQWTCLIWSFCIDRFLKKNSTTAVNYIENEADVFELPLFSYPSQRGFGVRRFYWKMLQMARKEIAIMNFEGNILLAQYCKGCYKNPICKRKYALSCDKCAVGLCMDRAAGHVCICRHFVCGKRIEKD